MQYYAVAKSNYFRVKNEDEFKEWAESISLTVYDKTIITEEGTVIKKFMITPDNEEGGWPVAICNEDIDDYMDCDVAEDLAKFLEDEEVAILIQVGNEGIRHIEGFVTAINNKEQRIDQALSDITARAGVLGDNIDLNI